MQIVYARCVAVLTLQEEVGGLRAFSLPGGRACSERVSKAQFLERVGMPLSLRAGLILMHLFPWPGALSRPCAAVVAGWCFQACAT